MFEGITISLSSLRPVLDMLQLLVPKGESEVPVGLHKKGSELYITSTQGCAYQSHITIDYDGVIDTTFMYRDITPLLPTMGDVMLYVLPNYVEISGEGFSVSFPIAYSTVEVLEIGTTNFRDIDSTVYQTGLSKITGMGLEKLLLKVSPIIIRDNIAIQKYPNVWVQTRANGLGVSAVIDTVHTKLLTRFSPTGVTDSIPGTLLFKGRNGTLQIPCRADNDSSSVKDLLVDMESVLTINLQSYLDKVRTLSKIDPKGHCNVILYESGMFTRMSVANSNMKIGIGNTTGEVVQTVTLPIQLWLSFLKCIGTDTRVEILVGGGKLCLRTPFVIILTRVLS